MASSYSRISEAFLFQGKIDSAIAYAEKTNTYINYVDQKYLPYYLNTIGYAYINKDNYKAKSFFEKSLSYKPLTRTFENLAYIYHQEGNEEKAYELWKQALLTEDNAPQDRILYNIL